MSNAEDPRNPSPTGGACARAAGFRVLREGRHVVMSDGGRLVTVPRRDPVNGYTMGGIVHDAGLSEEEFRRLL